MSLLDKYVRKKSSANNLTVKQLVDFRTHIGTKFSFRNPLIDEYIYGLNISKNIIFNSSISLFLLRRTLNFLEVLKKDNGQVLFVGTNGDFSKLVKFAGESTGQPYVFMRWIKGLLTNCHMFVTIKPQDILHSITSSCSQNYDNEHSNSAEKQHAPNHVPCRNVC